MPISHRALIGRINRRLKHVGWLGEALRTCGRNSRSWLDLGDYYTVDIRKNFATRTHVDLESLGEELSCLREYERLDEEAA